VLAAFRALTGGVDETHLATPLLVPTVGIAVVFFVWSTVNAATLGRLLDHPVRDLATGVGAAALALSVLSLLPVAAAFTLRDRSG
jgi:hypothetical protein